MLNAVRAYLQTEGKLDYRDCQIVYYTYTVFETPHKFRINVNVHVQTYTQQYKRTLNIDDNFDVESEAINFGIEQGKKYIDQIHASGKVSFIKPSVAKNSVDANKSGIYKPQQDIQKKDRK